MGLALRFNERLMKTVKKRPEFRNVSIPALVPYVARFPAPAWVSLLHRVSGVLLFLLLPAVIWAFDASLRSEVSFAMLKSVFNDGYGPLPGWGLKLVALAILWAYTHHLVAGVRFVVLDVKHSAVQRDRAARSARWVLIVSIGVTIVVSAKIFSWY